jgi:DNA-binding NarL/FixJ family response regulator
MMRPELIVLDLNLPDRRGEDVLRELASGEATRAIPWLSPPRSRCRQRSAIACKARWRYFPRASSTGSRSKGC